jgi:hypothetical protein
MLRDRTLNVSSARLVKQDNHLWRNLLGDGLLCRDVQQGTSLESLISVHVLGVRCDPVDHQTVSPAIINLGAGRETGRFHRDGEHIASPGP